MKTLSGTRLREHLDENKISYAEFAAQIGVEPQNVNNWFARGVPNARIFAVADALGVLPRWLADGEEPKTVAEVTSLESRALTAPEWDAEQRRRLQSSEQLAPVFLEPLFPWDDSTPLDVDEVELKLYKEVELASGHGRTAVEEVVGPKLRFSRYTMRTCGVDPSNAVFATNSGDSNSPLILHGATVGVDKGMTKIIDGEIYALDHDGLLRVKFIERIPGGIRLRSFNQAEYKDEDFTFEQVIEQRIVILGRVFWWSTIRPLRSPALLQ